MADIELAPLPAPNGNDLSPPAASHDEAARDDDDDDERKSWSSPLDHLGILLCFVGGIGQVLRFPHYYYANGGGAFLLVYLLLLGLFGIPLMLLESFVGQFSSSNSIGAYSSYPAFKGIGIANCIVLILICPCFTVSIGFSLLYLVYSFTYIDKWGVCGNYWNSYSCVDMGNYNESDYYATVPAMEFYQHVILNVPEGGFSWSQSLAVLLVWIIAFCALFGGVKVLGKVMWVTAGTSLLLLIALFFRGVTLPGAREGLKFLVYFDVYSLISYNTWNSASSHVLYTYTLGFGIYTTLGSFSKFRHSVVRDVLAVAAASLLMEIFSAITVWSIIGFLMHNSGMPVYEAASSGGGSLSYGTLPQAFSMMSQPTFWSTLFSLTMFLLSISTFIVFIHVLVELVSTAFRRRCQKQWLLVLVVCLLGFLFSLVYCSSVGNSWLSFVDNFATILTPLVVCGLEVIIFVYLYGAGYLARDVEMLSNSFVSYYCYFTWSATVPLFLLMIFISNLLGLISISEYFGFQGAVYLFAISSALAIPIYSLFYVFRDDCCKKLKWKVTPWGPKRPSDRTAWERFCNERPVRRSLVHRRF
ncbi:sodium-dependent proline transporter-like isoform X2 [Penaeus chinensis]|nr:sodium-dependent proline transporter-like isoform X2 [Penaeus chinensis]XP_047477031.1 sodium-dependent proline transporter-like isoform X2 [Penaeus chinensis]XP_047477032.1 sodium-dependent proline transporter-like isoform X2 [Penaeus chinensis]